MLGLGDREAYTAAFLLQVLQQTLIKSQKRFMHSLSFQGVSLLIPGFPK
jgi:hypothetical protein